MNNKVYEVLIIEDQPLITVAYELALNDVSKHNDTMSFNIDAAIDCDTADKKINNFSVNNKNIDIVFLDISLPPSKDGKILSGEDLGLKINNLIPNAKIIISTAFSDNHRIYSLIKNLNPDGFLVKNDLNPRELRTAIKTVIIDLPYYSKTVIKFLRNKISSDFIIDSIDRNMLHELSIGTMMKDLPKILFLSLPALEKRKRHLKQVFETEGLYDKELLLKAKEKGFI